MGRGPGNVVFYSVKLEKRDPEGGFARLNDSSFKHKKLMFSVYFRNGNWVKIKGFKGRESETEGWREIILKSILGAFVSVFQKGGVKPFK